MQGSGTLSLPSVLQNVAKKARHATASGGLPGLQGCNTCPAGSLFISSRATNSYCHTSFISRYTSCSFFLCVPAAQDNRSSLLSLKKKKCPHCQTEISPKNLAKHVRRKHNVKTKDITFYNHFKSICVDATNGISIEQKTSHGFSLPIHVQKKTWGRPQTVVCELEECKQCHLMAVRSGLMF